MSNIEYKDRISPGFTRTFITSSDDKAKAVDEGAGVCLVLKGSELVPHTGLLQGQAQAGESPLQVHTQGQLVLKQPPHNHLNRESHTQGKKEWIYKVIIY